MEILFAERLKELRKAEGLCQRELAEQIGIGQSNISDWENGVSRPEYENLMRIARIFDVSTDYLLGLTDYYSDI